jgi:molecular chaperone DnaK (HSP70)
MDLQFIMTVPAVWSDKAKDATMQAATLAGIPSAGLFLVSEPEAAAVYAIQTIQPNTMTVSFHPEILPKRF